MSCRSEDIGADTIEYVYLFRQIGDTPWNELFTRIYWAIDYDYELKIEFSYLVFNKIVSLFSRNEQAITIANSMVCIMLLYILVSQKSKYPFLSVWLYVTLGIFQTQMNMQRNAIGILISYLAFGFLAEKKPLRFFTTILASASIHLSSILFLPLYWFSRRAISSSKKLLLTTLFFAIFGLLFWKILDLVTPFAPQTINMYFAARTSSTHFEFLGVLGAHLILFFATYSLIKRERRRRILILERIGIWMFLLDVFFFGIGIHSFFGPRIAGIFGPYLILLLPNMLAEGIQTEKREKAITIVLLISGAQYVLRLFVNNIGHTMPYQFFFS